MATKPKTKSDRPTDKGLQVTAKVNRPYWRGQIEFGPEPKFVPFSELTEEQELEIREDTGAEGTLFVAEVDAPKPAAEAAA